MVTLCWTSHRDVAVGAFAHGVVESGTSEKRGDVVTRPPCIRAGRAVSRKGGVNESWVQAKQCLGVHPEALLAFRQQIAEEHIGVGHQPMEYRRALFVTDIDRDRLLAAVVDIKLEVVRLEFVGQLRRPHHVTHWVTREWLDFDDVGAHVGQDRATRWCSHPVVDFDDCDVVEGFHASLSAG